MIMRFIRSPGIPMPALFLAKQTALSDPHRNSAPSRNPDTATSHAGVFPAASARWMAGCNSDQKLAAIITPEEKPNIRFSALALGDLKKTTVAAPSAVTNQVPSVAISANQT